MTPTESEPEEAGAEMEGHSSEGLDDTTDPWPAGPQPNNDK